MERKYLSPIYVIGVLEDLKPNNVFQLTFTKKNGEDREMTASKADPTGLKFDPRSRALIPVLDLQKGKYRMVNLTTVSNIRVIA